MRKLTVVFPPWAVRYDRDADPAWRDMEQEIVALIEHAGRRCGFDVLDIQSVPGLTQENFFDEVACQRYRRSDLYALSHDAAEALAAPMLFSSYTFLFQFLPATLLAFAAARRHSPRAGIMVLLGASLFFYGAWRPVYLLLLLASIAVNFCLGLRMEDPLRRRAIGMFGVALNLAVLCYFKYTNFILDSLNALTGAPLPFVNIILPLGISFFTFQQIAYLVDVMRGARVERDIVSYALFVSFFPHLIAGPLVHHAEMIPQFKRGRTGRSAVLAARGLAIFAAGLFKKVVIADNLAQFVSAGIRASRRRRRRHHAVGVAGDAGLHAANLFRFLRLFRHGDRAGAVVRHPAAGEFPLALQGRLDHRFLAALAHHAVALPARLSLHSARRQPARRAAPLSEFAGDDAARRALARRRLEFSGVGRPARALSRVSIISGSPGAATMCAQGRALRLRQRREFCLGPSHFSPWSSPGCSSAPKPRQALGRCWVVCSALKPTAPPMCRRGFCG